MRRKLLLGNWKMNKTISEAKDFAAASIELVELAHENNIDVGVAPTFLSLDIVRKTNPNIIVAAQNVNDKDSGAFTGEISVPMLKDINITWSLTGHSERRTYNGETNQTCNKKNIHLLENDMIPVYCVGETLVEFENGLTKEIVKTQVVEGLSNIDAVSAEKVIIAYEPVWSIGTGRNASKEIAQDVCGFIRNVVAELYNDEVAQKIRILYGGSVKPENIREYLSAEDIDGALVGGASLNIDSYKQLLTNII